MLLLFARWSWRGSADEAGAARWPWMTSPWEKAPAQRSTIWRDSDRRDGKGPKENKRENHLKENWLCCDNPSLCQGSPWPPHFISPLREDRSPTYEPAFTLLWPLNHMPFFSICLVLKHVATGIFCDCFDQQNVRDGIHNFWGSEIKRKLCKTKSIRHNFFTIQMTSNLIYNQSIKPTWEPV